MAVSHVRLRKQQQGSPFWWVCGSLVLLGGLIAVSLPSVPMAREAARRSQCKNNLKQIALAVHNFMDASGGAFPVAASGDPPVSWRVELLPYLDRASLVGMYHRDQTWDHADNEPVAKTSVSGLMCPSSRDSCDKAGWFYSRYVMLTGPGTVSPGNTDVRKADVTDGMANSMLVAEACGLEIVWTSPRDFDVSRQPVGVNLKGTGETDSPGLLSSYHAQGAQAAFADGSVKFINQNISPHVLQALTTIAAGESLPEP